MIQFLVFESDYFDTASRTSLFIQHQIQSLHIYTINDSICHSGIDVTVEQITETTDDFFVFNFP